MTAFQCDKYAFAHIMTFCFLLSISQEVCDSMSQLLLCCAGTLGSGTNMLF